MSMTFPIEDIIAAIRVEQKADLATLSNMTGFDERKRKLTMALASSLDMKILVARLTGEGSPELEAHHAVLNRLYAELVGA